jgi:ankyrin repeat protein
MINKVLMQVDSADEYLVTPLHMAAKYGVVDTARELLEHGADKDRCSADIAGRGALHYAHTPDMIRCEYIARSTTRTHPT